jgi:hypothetical protein
VNEANEENLIETNTCDDLMVNEMRARLIENRKSVENELYKSNDGRMPFQSQCTQDRGTIKIANRSYQIIDQWPSLHHNTSTNHTQYDPAENARDEARMQARQLLEKQNMSGMQNGWAQSEQRNSHAGRFNVTLRPTQPSMDVLYSDTLRARGEEFLLSRAHTPSSSVLSSQGRTINLPQYSEPMRHLSNAWQPSINHAAAQIFNPNHLNSNSLTRASQAQGNQLHLPKTNATCSIGTQTNNADTFIAVENASVVPTVARASTIDKSKCSLKLGTYDGATEIGQFLMRLEICKRGHNWSDAEVKHQLICALSGPAAHVVLKTDLENEATAEGLVQRLKERFGSEHLVALRQLQLNSLRQKPGESLAQLAANVRQLSCEAFEGKRSFHSDSIETRAFIDSIADRSVALQTLQASPATLDQAIRHALRFESFLEVEKCNEKRFGRQRVHIDTVQEEAPSIQRRLQNIEQSLGRLEHAKNEERNGWHSDDRRPHQRNNRNPFRGQPRQQWNRDRDGGTDRPWRHEQYSDEPPVDWNGHGYNPG